MDQFENLIGPDFNELTRGINMISVFSLSKGKQQNLNPISLDSDSSKNKVSLQNQEHQIKNQEFEPPAKRIKTQFENQDSISALRDVEDQLENNEGYMDAFCSLKQKIQ